MAFNFNETFLRLEFGGGWIDKEGYVLQKRGAQRISHERRPEASLIYISSQSWVPQDTLRYNLTPTSTSSVLFFR